MSELMGFASRTSSARNVKALQDAGWGWLVGPLDHGHKFYGMPHALDNGEWVAFSTQTPWNEKAFVRAVQRHGPTSQFIIVPDVVADREASMRRTMQWLPRLRSDPTLQSTRLLIAIQDDMAFEDVEHMMSDRIGIFIGGSTEWKVNNIIPWGLWAHAKGIYSHVGRVNTAKRINLCLAGKIRSFDGTSATMYSKTLPMLDQARRQGDFGIDPLD